MNILVKLKEYYHIMPAYHVLMNNNSYYSFINIFQELKLNLHIDKIKLDPFTCNLFMILKRVS